MESTAIESLDIGLKSKGFHLEFEAKADVDGGFECYIYSNRTHVTVLMGKNMLTKNGGGEAKMVYKHYCCPLGDEEYLESLLELEGIMKKSTLMASVYGELFNCLIKKIKSYGTSHTEMLIRSLERDDSMANVDIDNLFPKSEAVHAVCN